ncbi:MAG: hypothetical protein R2711_04125 [Acidimicrobiales bacterium]
MTPVFGEGVVFDASPEERRRHHNQSLRDKFMRGHAATITAEIERMLADWDDEGRSTCSTSLPSSSSTPRLRASSATSSTRSSTATWPSSSTTSAAPTPSPSSTPARTSRASAGDAARAELVEIIQGIMDRRRRQDLRRRRGSATWSTCSCPITNPDIRTTSPPTPSPACSSR